MTAIIGVCVAALVIGLATAPLSVQTSRRQDLFIAEILAAFGDGMISEEDMRQITRVQWDFGIIDKHIRAVIALVRDPHTNDNLSKSNLNCTHA